MDSVNLPDQKMIRRVRVWEKTRWLTDWVAWYSVRWKSRYATSANFVPAHVYWNRTGRVLEIVSRQSMMSTTSLSWSEDVEWSSIRRTRSRGYCERNQKATKLSTHWIKPINHSIHTPMSSSQADKSDKVSHASLLIEDARPCLCFNNEADAAAFRSGFPRAETCYIKTHVFVPKPFGLESVAGSKSGETAFSAYSGILESNGIADKVSSLPRPWTSRDLA